MLLCNMNVGGALLANTFIQFNSSSVQVHSVLSVTGLLCFCLLFAVASPSCLSWKAEGGATHLDRCGEISLTQIQTDNSGSPVVARVPKGLCVSLSFSVATTINWPLVQVCSPAFYHGQLGLATAKKPKKNKNQTCDTEYWRKPEQKRTRIE